MPTPTGMRDYLCYYTFMRSDWINPPMIWMGNVWFERLPRVKTDDGFAGQEMTTL